MRLIPRSVLLLIALTGSVSLHSETTVVPSSPEVRLTHFLDSLNVDKLWLPGKTVNWETGEALDKPSASHCSAFAAAVAKRLDIYLLRPPEHGQTLLANAQHDWLEEKGASKGWHHVKSGVDAQEEANHGNLVVAVLENPNPKKAGHIAIVRPGHKTTEEIKTEGPNIIQAGGTNYVSASLKTGFARHPGAFEQNQIEFYSHEVAADKLP